MNTTTIIGIAAAVVVVGAGMYFFMSYNPSGQVATVSEHEGGEEASVGSTFADIIAGGQPVECTFTYDDGAGNASSGTVYVASQDRFRGDFSVTAPVEMEMHVVRIGGFNYMWGTSLPQGMKVAVTEENQDQIFDSATATIDPNTEYKCMSWQADESMFELPAGVQFIDVNAAFGS